jgi:hypothetical protein
MARLNQDKGIDGSCDNASQHYKSAIDVFSNCG